MVKAETKPVVEKVPDMRFPKGSHKKFTDALAALSASTGKVIDENIDICGKSVHLFDASVLVKHRPERRHERPVEESLQISRLRPSKKVR